MKRSAPPTVATVKKPLLALAGLTSLFGLTVFAFLPLMSQAADDAATKKEQRIQAAMEKAQQNRQANEARPGSKEQLLRDRRQAIEQHRQEKANAGTVQQQFTPDPAKGIAARESRKKIHAERQQQRQAAITKTKNIRTACTAKNKGKNKAKADTAAIELCYRDALLDDVKQRIKTRHQELTQARAKQ